MNKPTKLILRISVSPFLLCILLITYFVHAIRHFINFTRYGGEWINYIKSDRETILDIYNELKLLREQRQKENDINININT